MWPYLRADERIPRETGRARVVVRRIAKREHGALSGRNNQQRYGDKYRERKYSESKSDRIAQREGVRV